MLRSFFLAIIGCHFIFYSLFSQDLPIKINSVTISGNESISKKELMPLLRQRPSNFSFKGTSFNGRLLKMDSFTLKNYFISKGFLLVDVKESYEIKDNIADIHFKISEGKQFFVSKVNISGNQNLADDKIQNILSLHEGEPFNSVLINERITELQKELEYFSKLFPAIEIEPVISDSVKVFITISEGLDIYINKTFIEGIDMADSALVFREILFKAGDYYSPETVDKSKRRLRETGIYSMVNLVPIKVTDSDSLVNIVISLNKYKQREWLSVGGYEPIEFYEGLDPLPAIGGFIEWRNRSIFKSSTNFSTKFLIGFPWETNFTLPRLRYDIGFDTNWILGIRWPTKISSFYETLINYDQETIDQVERYGLEMSQSTMFDERSYIQNVTVWEYFSDNKIENNSATINDSLDIIQNTSSIKDLQQRSLSIRFHFDIKDDPLFPKKGYLFDIYFKSTGYILGGERDYRKLDLSFHSYSSINKKSVVAARFKVGRLWSWDQSDIDYSYEKFYLGGSSNMRGWEILKYRTKDSLGVIPVGGTFRFLTNIELRTQLSQSLGINIFYDGGILEDDYKNFTKGQMGWDTGIGLTLSTPLGPVRLDYAVPSINDNI
ncbi:MAG: BamA/TamA family outer membrane protein, partial [Candidatus Neomarinimicrobiota bacterium]|nr:BamA/TamA family outer membrane protein [Candidatus Neomarinimicrobiota bacterium]